MQEKVRKTMKKYHMCAAGQTITVGVSGGADSMALLHILWQLSKKEGFQVQALHVHHGLRGEEADRDAAFVADWCRQRQILCETVFLDVAEEAKKSKEGLEETGRKLRYQALRRMAAGGSIAVAHHANDQAETLLMRLCRGTGLTGLVSMRPVQKDIIRPLLFCTRAETEKYCKEQGISWCEDSTNRQTLYTRNKLRHEVLPLLEKVHPGSGRHLAETAELLAMEEDFLEESAKEAFLKCREQNGFLVKNLQKLHPALRRRVLRLAVAEKCGQKDITKKHIESLEALVEQESGKSVALPHKMQARAEYGRLIIEKPGEKPREFCYDLVFGKEVFIPECGIWVLAEISSEKKGDFLEDDYTKVFDYDKIKQDLCCRNRKTGDRMYFAIGSKKLKDYFIDEKIPRGERECLPLIAGGSAVLWIVGKRVSEAYLPSAHTTRYVTVQIRRVQNNERKN